MNRVDWLIVGKLIGSAQADPIDGVVWLRDFAEHPAVPTEVLYSSLKELEGAGFVASKLIGPDAEDDSPEEVFAITPLGVARAMAHSEEVVGSFRGLLWDFPEDVEEAYLALFEQQDRVEIVPASDRTVRLNHNRSEYQDAVAALDKVLEEFRNDHRLDNEDKEGKDAITKILEGGRRFLDREEITVEQADSWLLKPLKWILGKFTEGTLQAAAAKALELVCKLVGLGS